MFDPFDNNLMTYLEVASNCENTFDYYCESNPKSFKKRIYCNIHIGNKCGYFGENFVFNFTVWKNTNRNDISFRLMIGNDQKHIDNNIRLQIYDNKNRSSFVNTKDEFFQIRRQEFSQLISIFFYENFGYYFWNRLNTWMGNQILELV